MTTKASLLPDKQVEQLKKLRASDQRAFRAYVRDLRAAGWTLASISDPFNSPRSTSRAWELSAPDLDEVPATRVPIAPRRAARTLPRVRRLHADIPADEIPELQRLAVSARAVRGWTPRDAQSRRDAEALERLLEHYVARGVPVKRIARHMGVTYRAVAARLERRAVRAAEESLDAA